MTLSRRQFFQTLAAPHPAEPDLYTPTDQFFQQYARPTPTIDSRYWSFSIGGSVRHPLSLSLDDLLALPSVDLACTVVCASIARDHTRIGTARWHGVRLRTLLDALDISPAVTSARLESADGRATHVSVTHLDRALLAYRMNDMPLLPEHGYPVRLIVPGRYDHQMPRWITRIELGSAAEGLLESAVQPVAAITSPRHLSNVTRLIQWSGYAYAGDESIQLVELSIDGGAWMPVTFTPPERYCCVRWHADSSLPSSGDVQASVRATTASGTYTMTHSIVLRGM